MCHVPGKNYAGEEMGGCAVCQVKKFWKRDFYSPARQRKTPPSGFAAHLVLSGPLCPTGISPPRGESPPFRGGYKEEN